MGTCFPSSVYRTLIEALGGGSDDSAAGAGAPAAVAGGVEAVVAVVVIEEEVPTALLDVVANDGSDGFLLLSPGASLAIESFCGGGGGGRAVADLDLLGSAAVLPLPALCVGIALLEGDSRAADGPRRPLLVAAPVENDASFLDE